MQGMKLKNTYSKIQQTPGVLSVVALVFLLVLFSQLSEYFFTAQNLLSIMLTASTVSLIAIGQFTSILCGYTDMAVGNVAAMAGVLAGMAVKDWGMSVPMGILLGLAFGLLHGFIVGLCIARFNCNSWVTTYALFQVYRGAIFLITRGVPVAIPSNEPYSAAFKFLGQYKLFGVIQFPIIIMLVVLALFAFMLKYTKLGRSLYCVGNNPEAAKISGLDVRKTIMFAFICVGVLSSLCGIVFGSRVNSCQPNSGATYGMDTIAACVVGGTRLSGGKGNIFGAFCGILIVYVIQNGLIMCGLDAYYHYIVTGIIMFLAVLMQTIKRKQ